MSIEEFQPQQRARLRELLQDATIQHALRIVEQRCPRAFIPGADTKLEQVGLQAAHVQGYKDCMSVLYSLAADEPFHGESPFMEMNDEPESDRNHKRE